MNMLGGAAVLVIGLCGLGGCGEGFDAQWESTSEEIVGGAAFAGLPAVGLITYDGHAHCTGTVVASRLVVTAAHCVDRFDPARMRFLIGNSLAEAQATLDVSAATAHPDFDRLRVRDDIGFLRLRQDAPVEPLGVLRRMDAAFQGRELYFVGFGADNGREQSGSGRKRAVWIKVSEVDDSTFRYDDPKRNTCNGDSGGPALYQSPQGQYQLAGVTSYGDTWCETFGVDTRVDRYLSFLGL